MPEEISRHNPGWLEHLRRAFAASLAQAKGRPKVNLDTGDSLMNEKLYKILQGLEQETWRPGVNRIEARAPQDAERLLSLFGMQGYWDTETGKIAVMNNARDPIATMIHELTHARTHDARVPFLRDEEVPQKKELIRRSEASGSYWDDPDEVLSRAMAARMAAFADDPRLRIRQQDYDQAYTEELRRLIGGK